MAKRYSKAYTSSRYNTSSNAYDYDTGIFEDDIERMRREAQKKEERENEIIKRKGFIHRIKFTAAIFAVFAGCIVTIDALCEAVWGDNPFGYENSLMAHIRRIREKIEQNPSQPVSLVTIKGLGYKLNVEGR